MTDTTSSSNIFKTNFTVRPVKHGSFMVHADSLPHSMGDSWAFTNIDDLMTWLRAQSEEFLSLDRKVPKYDTR